jgi:hypothetical protein
LHIFYDKSTRIKDIVSTFGGEDYQKLDQSPAAPSADIFVQPPVEANTDLTASELTVDVLEQLVPTATNLVCRLDLINGKGGWSYNRIFTRELLAGAASGLLLEPYLLKSHQMKNLVDFITTIQRTTSLKTLWLVTGEITEEKAAGTDARLNALAKDLFHQAGITLNWRREAGIHDRYVAFDNGVLFKMGRGLDIFQAAGGLALNNQQLRKVRGCSIDVFRAS